MQMVNNAATGMLAQMQLSSWDQAILINKVKAFIFSGCSSVKERLNTVQTWPASCRQDDPWQHPWRGEASPDPFSSPLLVVGAAKPVGDASVQGNVVSHHAGWARSPRWSKAAGRRLVRRDRAREAGSCWATWAPEAQPG